MLSQLKASKNNEFDRTFISLNFVRNDKLTLLKLTNLYDNSNHFQNANNKNREIK